MLPQNPVGTTYSGVVTQPTYYVGQTSGNDDGWKIYGESPSGTNTGNTIIQSEDDYDGNESIRLRFKRTYSPFSTNDILVAKYNSLGINTVPGGTYVLEVGGAASATTLNLTETSAAPLTVASTTRVVSFNADLLDGQHGSYYLNYANLTGTPTIPTVNNNTITITAGSGLTGNASFTLNQSTDQTITLAVGAGTAITVGGNDVSHADTSTLTGAYGTNGISSITVDDLGHVTAISTATYYLASNPNGYTTNTGTVTSVAAGTGLTGGTITTSGTISLSTPVTLANGGTGATSLSAGSVLFSNGSAITQDNSNFYWDDTNNRLGIGLNSPTQPLHVNGNIRLVAGSSVWIGAESDSGDRLRLHQSSTNAYIDWGAGTLYLRSGAATSAARGELNGSGDFLVSGNVTGYGSPSDRRFKENITPVKDALTTILKLEGVTFSWKNGSPLHRMTNVNEDIGFIAQQVQEVLPGIVRENDEGYLSIRERAIVPLLVEAIKEQQKQIDELKKELGKE